MKRKIDTLPPANQQFRLTYEGLHHSDGPWCTVRIYASAHLTLLAVITDESDEHQDCSITSRIERICYLIWNRLGRPTSDMLNFCEHYRGRHEPALSFIDSEHLDVVTFPSLNHEFEQRAQFCAGKQLGAFGAPTWAHVPSGAWQNRNYLVDDIGRPCLGYCKGDK